MKCKECGGQLHWDGSGHAVGCGTPKPHRRAKPLSRLATSPIELVRAKPFRRWSYDVDTWALAYDDGNDARLVLGDSLRPIAEALNRARVVLPTNARGKKGGSK